MESYATGATLETEGYLGPVRYNMMTGHVNPERNPGTSNVTSGIPVIPLLTEAQYQDRTNFIDARRNTPYSVGKANLWDNFSYLYFAIIAGTVIFLFIKV